MSKHSCPNCGSYNTEELTGIGIDHVIEGICHKCNFQWIIKSAKNKDNVHNNDSGFIDPSKDKPGI